MAIGETLSINVTDEDITKFCDVEEEINVMVADQNVPHEVDSTDAYNKVKHGNQIIEWMYQNGQSIEEIEQFLDSCVREVEV